MLVILLIKLLEVKEN